MNPNLKQAIIEFLANEFHLHPEDILPDSDFYTDFGLTIGQLSDLITRIQDALDFILPEDKITDIGTVADLLRCLEPEISPHEPL